MDEEEATEEEETDEHLHDCFQATPSNFPEAIYDGIENNIYFQGQSRDFVILGCEVENDQD